MEKFIKAGIIFCSVFFAFGCSLNESIPIVRNGEESRIKLFIPGADEVQVYSTATADENRIEDCFVVAFRGGVCQGAEMIDVAKIVANGQATALLPQLTTLEIKSNDKVYVLCNTGLNAVPGNMEYITENNIIHFPTAKAYYFSGEALPMAGSVVWSPTTSTTVTLTRAVAKVQVQLGESFSMEHFDWSGPFLPWDADDFRNNLDLCGFIVGNYAGASDIVQLSPSTLSRMPSSKSGYYATEKAIRPMQYATANNMAVYISEFPNRTVDCGDSPIDPPGVFNDKRQYLLMMDRIDDNNVPGGVIRANTSLAGYWRLDFYDAAKKEYLDIKRNHTYTFTINRILSGPYIDRGGGQPLSATFQSGVDINVWHLPGSNIEYSVAVSEDWANTISSNGQYALSVSADTINNGNINLPFKIKVHLSDDVDHDQIKPRFLVVSDSQGNTAGFAGSALEVYINGTIFPGGSFTVFDVLPSFFIDGRTNILTFAWNPSGSGSQYFNDAALYIYLGNIQKKIPIRLTAATP
jgi:hypothetical protein